MRGQHGSKLQVWWQEQEAECLFLQAQAESRENEEQTG